MRRRRSASGLRGVPLWIRLVALGNSIVGFGLPETAWADHPASPGWPWALVGFLLFALAFAVIWTLSAFLERWKMPPSKRRRPPESEP